jgi:hypothetical protein
MKRIKSDEQANDNRMTYHSYVCQINHDSVVMKHPMDPTEQVLFLVTGLRGVQEHLKRVPRHLEVVANRPVDLPLVFENEM